MSPLRAAVLSATFGIPFGLGLVAGCYSERLPPPTYRYPCDADSECPDLHACVGGLCQIPCSQATFAEDCPQEGTYLACFNGVCVSGCDVELTDLCPGSLECIDLGLDVSGGSFFGGGGGGTIGICGSMCDPSAADACPSGETCLEGYCVATCDPDAAEDTCGQGLVCTLGLCIPDTGDDGVQLPGDDDGSGTTNDDGSATETEDPATGTDGTGTGTAGGGQ